ncbi:MAG: hypothetical protein NC205_00755 [Prevotella sp.]|nr:hypothetical protein [Alistipes senegalensis]MCM1357092.1 hypothetical protein [Prevotella sp.]MCM1472586.1 hypothetical protein [Muribaculaceae bacterium]
MYEVVEVVQRIKNLARQKGVKTSDMLISCDLSKNALSSMNSRGSWIQANSLAKIADYLNVSVDYLLGRTNEPSGYSNNENSFNVGSNSTQTVGNYNNVSTGKTNEVSDDAREIDNILKSLSPKERVRFLSKIYDLEEELKKKEA